MVNTGAAAKGAVIVGIEGTGIGVKVGTEHFGRVVATDTGGNIIAGVGGVDICAIDEVFTYYVGTKGTAVVAAGKMAVGTGVRCGLLVGVGVVLYNVTRGVVARPAAGIYTVATFVGIVHIGMNTKAEVSTVDVTEVVAVAVSVVVLITAVMTA